MFETGSGVESLGPVASAEEAKTFLLKDIPSRGYPASAGASKSQL